VIPGARNAAQATANASAGSVPDLGPEFTAAVRDLYDRRIRASVHDSW
jgi:aryl-alcohol dehydrogenase-like predicted oxidoreductase